MDYEAAVRAKRTAKQVRSVIAGLHKEITGEALPTKTLAEFVAGWLEDKSKETADSTLVFYRGTSQKFLTFMGAASEQDIALITKQDVANFRNEGAGRLSAKTVNHDLKCLKMLFKAARRDGVIVEDPTEFVETIRHRKSDADSNRRAFTMDELKAVLVACDPEWRSMAIFGL